MSTPRRWRKSSRSNTQTNCVELSHTLDAVRDSKLRDGPALAIPRVPAQPRHLPLFLQQVKAGAFDR